MDSIDDKIKKLYDDSTHQDLPAGFGWEENQAQIYNKMENQPRKRRFAFWWLTGAGLLVLAPLVAFIIYNSEKTLSNNGEIVSSFVKDDALVSLENKKNTTVLQKASNIGEIKNSHDPKESAVNISKSTIQNTPTKIVNKEGNSIKLNVVEPKSTQYGLLNSIIKSELENSIPTEPKIIANTPDQTEITGKRESIVSLEIGTTYNTSLSFIHSIDDLQPKVVSMPVVERSVVETKNIWTPSLSIGGGSLLGFGEYHGLALRDDYSSWKPGFHTNIAVSMTNQNGWKASLDYSYDFAVQYFEFIDNDSIPHTAQNVITRITTNAITGDVTTKRSDVEQMVARYREYRTYNRFRSHSIGLTVGKEINLGKKVSFSLSTGARYSIVRKSSGFTIDGEEDVFEYASDDDTYYKSSAIDAVIGISLNYKLSNHVSLMLYSNANKSLTNWSSEVGVRYKPTLVQLGGGVKYNF